MNIWGCICIWFGLSAYALGISLMARPDTPGGLGGSVTGIGVGALVGALAAIMDNKENK